MIPKPEAARETGTLYPPGSVTLSFELAPTYGTGKPSWPLRFWVSVSSLFGRAVLYEIGGTARPHFTEVAQ